MAAYFIDGNNCYLYYKEPDFFVRKHNFLTSLNSSRHNHMFPIFYISSNWYILKNCARDFERHLLFRYLEKEKKYLHVVCSCILNIVRAAAMVKKNVGMVFKLYQVLFTCRNIDDIYLQKQSLRRVL